MRDQRCQTCPFSVAENCGHYQHNGDKPNKNLGGNALWYDERNFLGQCVRCNKYQNGKPQEAALFLQKKWGEGILAELNTLYRTPKKWTLEELEEIRVYYIERQKEL